MEHRQVGCTVNGPPGCLGRWRSGRWRVGIAAAAVMLGASIAPAQSSVYYGTIDATDKAQLAQWATHYWAPVESGGTPAGGASAFGFTNPAMNSAFFNPLRSTRPALEKVGSIQSSLCDGLNQFGLAYPAEVEGQRQAIRKAMLNNQIETPYSSNYAGTLEHLTLIFATPSAAGLSTWVEDGALVSVNLPLEQVSGTAYTASVASNVGTQSQGVMSVLINSGAAWSAAAQAGAGAGVPEWKALITGQASIADRFAQTVQGYLDAAGVNAVDQSASVSVVTANFGVYGEMPVAVVQLPDCKVLVDPLSGNVSGPFLLDSELDARALLSAHSEFNAGSGVQHYSKSGCVSPLAIWIPGVLWPGPVPILRLPVPALPTPTWVLPPFGPALPMNPSAPGWASPSCTVSPLTSSCNCSVYMHALNTTGRLIWRRDDYSCPATGACPPAGWTGCTGPSTFYWW